MDTNSVFLSPEESPEESVETVNKKRLYRKRLYAQIINE